MVKGEDIIRYVAYAFHVKPEAAWEQYPEYGVMRHPGGDKKWFAVLMHTSGGNVGMKNDDAVEVLSVKCDPMLAASLEKEQGFSRTEQIHDGNWISVLLDGNVGDVEIRVLLDMSYDLTA